MGKGIVTEWRGGSNPVPGRRVDVWLREDAPSRSRESSELIWDHVGATPFDILYYKVIE